MHSLDNKTLEALAELICGDGTGWYRAGWELPEIFRNAGVCCEDHDGSTRLWWTVERLKEYETTNIIKVILRIASLVEYGGNKEQLTTVVKRLNEILGVEGYEVHYVSNLPRIREIIGAIPLTTSGVDNEKVRIQEYDFAELTSNGDLATVLKMRWSEVIKCYNAEAYTATIILMGSVLEGVLLSIAELYSSEARDAKSVLQGNSKMKSIYLWTLKDFIDVAHKCSWIKKDTKDFSHILRDYRNFVHPYKQQKDNFTPTQNTCDIFIKTISNIFSDIRSYLDGQK